jgi:DNA-binding CsgD family transcriptional regulator
MAYSNQSQLDMLGDRSAEAIGGAKQAIAIARETGDAAVLSHALNNLGAAKWQIDRHGGESELNESLKVALGAGGSNHACRAYANIIWYLLEQRDLPKASEYLSSAKEFAEKAEQVAYLDHFWVLQGRVELIAARWDQAIQSLRHGLGSAFVTRSMGTIFTARALIRSGGSARELLEEIEQLTTLNNGLQVSAPAAAVVCEDAWFRGDLDTIRRIAQPAYDEACRRRRPTVQGELVYWLARSGERVHPLHLDDPYSLQAIGRWQDAAEIWSAAGYPYEHAAALAGSPNTTDRLEALTTLAGLGARPLARQIRAELRAAGIAGVPRGTGLETRRNNAGLTRRQLEVLGLLAEELTNAEIADRLVLSVRTADNHVAAILEKLGVHTREEAVARGHQYFDPED